MIKWRILIIQDVRYLTPSIEQALKETKEREDWDSISVERRR